MARTISLQDRYRGAMVGVLCGDALGAPYEWKSPEEIVGDLNMRGGLVPHEYEPFDYIEPWKKVRLVQKGQPTDDSELAAALAQSLIRRHGLDEEHLFYELRRFIIDRVSKLAKVAYGSGSTLRAALTPLTYGESLDKFTSGEIPQPPSNGSLMRSTPVALATYPNITKTVELAATQSRVTHRNQESVDACMMYSMLVNLMLSGFKPTQAWENTVVFFTHGRTTSDISPTVIGIKPTKPEYLSEIKGKEGWAVLSLRVALWASIEAESFADGIIKSISVGGDTDTYAAIAGGLLGARFGIQGIPQKWYEILQGKEVMLNLADNLYDMQQHKAA